MSSRQFNPETMGVLRVKGTDAPEVKFLDRRRTIGGEGVLHLACLSIKNESAGIEDDQRPL